MRFTQVVCLITMVLLPCMAQAAEPLPAENDGKKKSLETFLAHESKMKSNEDLAIFHSRAAGLMALHGQDPKSHFAKAITALNAIEATERQWYSYDLVEAYGYADMADTAVAHLTPFFRATRLELLGLTAQSYAKKRQTNSRCFTQTYDKWFAEYKGLIGKPNPQALAEGWGDPEEPELLDAATVYDASYEWILAQSMAGDIAAVDRHLTPFEANSVPVSIAGTLAEIACHRLWANKGR